MFDTHAATIGQYAGPMYLTRLHRQNSPDHRRRKMDPSFSSSMLDDLRVRSDYWLRDNNGSRPSGGGLGGGGGMDHHQDDGASSIHKPRSRRPNYSRLIGSAIRSLQEKGGSSQVHIVTYIETNHPEALTPKQLTTGLSLALTRDLKKGHILLTKQGGYKFAKPKCYQMDCKACGGKGTRRKRRRGKRRKGRGGGRRRGGRRRRRKRGRGRRR